MIPTARYTPQRLTSSTLRRAAGSVVVALALCAPAATDAHSSTAQRSVDSATKVATAAGHRGASLNGRRVYFRYYAQTGFSKPKYKPRTILFGQRSAVQRIRWSRWNGRVARGRGTVQVNTCQPNCANSRPSYYAVRVALSRVGVCGNRLEYFRFSFRYVSRKPAGLPRTYSEQHGC